MLWPVLYASCQNCLHCFLVIFLLKSAQSGQSVILIAVLYKHSYERTSYLRISEITDEIFWFRNFGPQLKWVKCVRVPIQAFPINFNLLTFPTFFIMFVHCVYELTLFMELCITILTTFEPVYCLFLTRQPPVGQGLVIHQVSRSHTKTHHNRYDSSRRVISSSQRPLPDNTQHLEQTSMTPVEFEPTISACERPQTADRRPRGYSNRLEAEYNYI